MFPLIYGVVSQGGESEPAGPPIAVPVANALTTQWTEFAGNGNSQWWDELDETTGNHDGDETAWISPLVAGATRAIHMLITPLPDPGVHTGHVIRAAARLLDDSAGGLLGIRAVLFDGSIPENVFVGSFVEVVSETYTILEWLLSEAQAGAIVDYTALRLTIDSFSDTGERRVIITAVELEVPEAE